ncbi:unnamed protein product [Discula destructiva]
MSPSAISETPAVLPSSQRCEPGSVNPPLAKWPTSATDGPVDAAAIVQGVIQSLSDNLHKLSTSCTPESAKTAASLFVEDGYWRDHLALSWELRTLKTRSGIACFLKNPKNLSIVEILVDTSTEFRAPKVASFSPEGNCQGIISYLNVTTVRGRGRGVVRLVEDAGNWKIWTLFTNLEEMEGFEEPRGPRRATGVQHGFQDGRKNWLNRRQDEESFTNADPDVLIIGAGQAGLTAHARLKMLNVAALIVDQNATVGDNWRTRYHQLVLHDPVWYDHLPYLPFPDWWPVFTPKDKLADFFDAYARLLELNVWTRTTVAGGRWDAAARRWTVTLEKRHINDDGSVCETRTLRPRHIILSTGHSGKANLPQIPGMDAFRGDVLAHSSSFPGAKPHSTGKKAVVVGACNSAHDICQDYVERGYDVTMVQRSSTCVVSSASILEGNRGLYEEGGPPVEDADLAMWATPVEVLKAVNFEATRKQQVRDGETLRGLAKAGFKVDRGPDECGLLVKYYQRGGGYYIDVGASQLIVGGQIKVKQGQEVVEVLPRGLRFADGSELEADEIVFATGYQNMRTQARGIFGDEVADRLGDVWGIDESGEFRALSRDSGHPGFWYHGGNLAICRYLSRVLALQIKAQLEGLVDNK